MAATPLHHPRSGVQAATPAYRMLQPSPNPIARFYSEHDQRSGIAIQTAPVESIGHRKESSQASAAWNPSPVA